MIKTYRDLIVWQKAMDLAVEVYRLTRDFPAAERYGLSAQLQRAAVSIPANLAEGHERKSRGDFRRAVSIARGSTAELETHLELARRLAYIPNPVEQKFAVMTAEVGKMLSTLLKRLSSRS